MLNQLKNLEEALGPDFDLVVITERFEKKMFKEASIQNMTFNTSQLHVVSTYDTHHVKFEEETSRPTIYISQCTQLNFLAAIENFKAPIIGFASPKVQTQVFNCHKLLTENAGIPVDIQDKDLDLIGTINQILKDQTMFQNASFYHKLLVLDERRSKMDMNYWLDYVQQFGVKELIPVYDKMGPIEYRNWDVYAMLWTLAAIIVWVNYKIFSFCCCKSKKVKVD